MMGDLVAERLGPNYGDLSWNELEDRFEEALEAADALAGGVRSFLSSLPYAAPESLGMQANVKLAEPLASWDDAKAIR